MKRLLLILLFASLAGSYNISVSEDTKVLTLDTNVFKYFPLNTGNRWTWNVYRNFNPGLGIESAIVTGTQMFNNHIYYKTRWDTYTYYTNQYTSGYVFYRIDSLTGNLYNLYLGSDTTECLVDSLNSAINDSTYIYCGIGNGQWYRHNVGTYNIFNQSFPTKIFGWSNYFEAWGERKYAKNIGRVYVRGQGMMTYTEITLKGCLINGILYGDTTFPVGINQISSEIPNEFSLSQNYPNPFNPVTNIKFQIPKSGLVKLIVYDMLGRVVEMLVNQELSPGTYEADFDASNLPSGVFYYKLETDSYTETKKMVLIK